MELWDAIRTLAVSNAAAALWAAPIGMVGAGIAYLATTRWDEDTDAHWDDEL